MRREAEIILGEVVIFIRSHGDTKFSWEGLILPQRAQRVYLGGIMCFISLLFSVKEANSVYFCLWQREREKKKKKKKIK